MSLLDLPEEPLNRLLELLPQRSLINLALTNYHFYKPCTRALYKKILVSVDPVLHTCRWEEEYEADERNHTFGHRSDGDYMDVGWSVVSGLQHKLEAHGSTVYPEPAQIKMVNTKLLVLCNALEVNAELVQYVEDIVVLGGDFDPILLQKLADLVQHAKRFYIKDFNLRKKINLSNLKLQKVIADSPADLIEGTSELVISPNFAPTNLSGFNFSSVTSLILPSDPELFWAFRLPHLPNVTTFKFVFHDQLEQNQNLLNKLGRVVNLELQLNNNQLESLNLIGAPYTVRKLSIVQNAYSSLHSDYEKFDVAVMSYIQKFEELHFLSIRHNPSKLVYGKFSDGVEGNYLRRLKLYNVVLPQIISSNWPNLQLHLPNLFYSFAHYEQRMNTMLWIGCKCAHCSVYLSHLDQFLVYHKHYNREVGDGEWRDLNSSIIFTMIGDMMSQRYINEEMLLFEKLPYLNILWDMHSIPGEVPFRCYDVHIVDQGEFDEAETGKVEENFFEAQEEFTPCKYTKAVYQGLPRCIAHFLHTELVAHMTNLYRGDAEKLDTGDDFNDGGDELEYRLNKLVINGVNYNLGQELNGTNYFESVYD